ncbi:reverse transcriptase domain-containing protein [Phenylobacterium sp.]|uniref:reverse transcriptase domain-containing protein n=1 Tax=Phenylobacterium sp. TaxID=1871053 RepID=UPI0035B2F0E1
MPQTKTMSGIPSGAIVRKVRGIAPSAVENWWDAPQSNLDWLDQYISRYQRKLSRLAAAAKKGGKVISTARNEALHSYAGRICSLIYAAYRRGQKLSKDEIEQRAKAVVPWKDCGETITARFEKKKNGAKRGIIALGINRLALNYCVRDVLLTIWGTPPDDFAQHGKGTHRAARAVMDCADAGQRWFGVVDIANWYPSHRQEGLQEQLRLPESVIRNTILIGEKVKMIFPNGQEMNVPDRETLRLGLPQGMPTSALIASTLLSRRISELAPPASIIRFADDVAFLCETKDEAAAILKALQLSFASAPAGEFNLHHCATGHTAGGLKFLGYRIKTTAEGKGRLASVLACAASAGLTADRPKVCSSHRAPKLPNPWGFGTTPLR